MELSAPKPLVDGPNRPEEWKIFKRISTFLDCHKQRKECTPTTDYCRSGSQIYESFNRTDNNDKTDYKKVLQQLD